MVMKSVYLIRELILQLFQTFIHLAFTNSVLMILKAASAAALSQGHPLMLRERLICHFDKAGAIAA